jgi:hypothetical protein
MPKDFVSFCESLWQDWLAGKIETSPFLRKWFDLDAAPEPYISFGSGQKPLVLLTTNPGGTMRHQQRAAVQAGRGPLNPAIDYAAAAKGLGAFYEHQLARRAAGRRIAAMRALSASVGADGVVQVEVCPFHSRSLPNKLGLLREIDKGGLLTRYVEQVRSFLITRPVVAISAVPSRASLGPEVPLSRWVLWLSEMTGLDPTRAKFVPLVTKEAKVTAGALVASQDGVPKALVQMMGGNQLPGKHGVGILAEALRRQFRHAG